MSWNNVIPASMLDPPITLSKAGLEKLAARPKSKWATGNRLNQKGHTEPKGFARGARIK